MINVSFSYTCDGYYNIGNEHTYLYWNDFTSQSIQLGNKIINYNSISITLLGESFKLGMQVQLILNSANRNNIFFYKLPPPNRKARL